jgi:hypothetical protein
MLTWRVTKGGLCRVLMCPLWTDDRRGNPFLGIISLYGADWCQAAEGMG